MSRFTLWWMSCVGRASLLLPYRWHMKLARLVGRIVVRYMPERRAVAATNLRACFPERSEAEIDALAVRAFESLGMTLFEIIISWFMPEKGFKKLRIDYHGLEHFDAAIASGRGVLVCAAHFGCGELIGRDVGPRWRMSGVVHKYNNDSDFDEFRREKAATYLERTVTHFDFKGMIDVLRGGGRLLFLPDHDLGVGGRVSASFFGVPIEALSAPIRLARAGRALIVPAFFNRLPDDGGYEVHVHEPYEPDGDVGERVQHYYDLLEQHVRANESEYLWTHRMFKTRPAGEPPFYG
jgi:KDO2-lipid IV(A) lauroyltransferase